MSRIDDILNELSNTIPEPQKREYTLLEDGKYIFGLVKIKNIQKINKKTGKTRPGYQLTFRCKDHPSAFVNLKWSSSTDKRSDMAKALLTMSEGKIQPDCSKSESFDFLKSCLGKWFTFSIEQNKWQDRIFMNLLGSIKPAKVEGSAFDFFNQAAPTGRDLPTGFEDMVPEVEEKDEDDIPWGDKNI